MNIIIYLCSELASKWPMTEALSADVQSPYPFLTRTRSIGVSGATAIRCLALKAIFNLTRTLVCDVSVRRRVDSSLQSRFVPTRGAIRAGSRETHRSNHAAFPVPSPPRCHSALRTYGPCAVRSRRCIGFRRLRPKLRARLADKQLCRLVARILLENTTNQKNRRVLRLKSIQSMFSARR